MKWVFLCGYTALVAGAVGLGFMRHFRLAAGPPRVSWSGLLFGHRGCRKVRGIPENTLRAFQYAFDNGCKGVECDVRLTKDDEVVVFHDNNIDGQLDCPQGRKRIDELTLKELKSYRYLEDPTGKIRVPTLEETVLLCRKSRTKILIEVKDLRNIRRCVDKILTLYQRYPEYMYEQTTIISFNPIVLYYIRQLDAKVATGSIYEREFIRYCINSKVDEIPRILHIWPAFFDCVLLHFQEWVASWFLGCSLMCPDYRLYSEAKHRRWQSQGITLYFWGFEDNTVCTPEFKQPGIFIAADDKYEGFK
ncbi:unnamed protein product [Phytomonas sp. Hart1]|nr:unnamed protein product [Phytomonas sp. Hart1]|eukprot:CCW65917.1 unnamed protein product [Phytomonas sp. isolate Hart1]